MPSGQPGFKPTTAKILDPQDNSTTGQLICKPPRYAMGISGLSSAAKAFYKNPFGIRRPGASEHKVPMK
jgi:hypothetical protein